MVRLKDTLLAVSFVAALISVSGCGPKASAKAGNIEPSLATVPIENAGASTTISSPASVPPAPSAVAEEAVDEPEESDIIEDDPESEDEQLPLTTGRVVPHPFDNWGEAELESALSQDLASLGSMSVGSPNAGALVNGVQATENELLRVVSPHGAWATSETLAYLEASLRKVHADYPNTPSLDLGDISAKRGGPLRPHISHQSGRDVDIGFFYNNGQRWYARGTAKNLDLARNWAFIRALVSETDVEMILIDHSIQALLKRYALESGEDPDWVDSLFRGKAYTLRPIIRHARGHATHFHIRFFNPIAQESARRAYTLLAKHRIISPLRTYVTHKVKKGETLGMLARKYRTTVRVIRSLNGLRSTLIRARSTLRIPGRAGVKAAKARVTIPPRRLPPPRRNTHNSSPSSAQFSSTGG